MKKLAIILTASLLAAPASGEPPVAAALKVAEGQDQALAPYRLAELSLTSNAPVAAETVLLRPVGGGPVVRCALAVAPGQTATREVALPAVWPTQMYKVTALDTAEKVLGFTVAEITWPGDLAATDHFIDDAFRCFTDAPAGWPARTRRKGVLLLAIFAVAAAAVLFIRPPWLRTAVVVVVAGAAVAAALHVPGWPGAVESADYHLQIHPHEGPVKLDSFAVLAARRTSAVWRQAHRIPYPVYPDRQAALEEPPEVTPEDCAIRLTVRRGQVRILRPAKDRPLATEVTFIDSSLRDVGGVLHVRPVPGFGETFLVRDDTAWALGASAAGKAAAVRPEQAKPVWEVLSRAQEHQLAAEPLRLFRYWRRKGYQRAGTFYQLAFSQAGRQFVLVVIEMNVVTATRPAPAAG